MASCQGTEYCGIHSVPTICTDANIFPRVLLLSWRLSQMPLKSAYNPVHLPVPQTQWPQRVNLAIKTCQKDQPLNSWRFLPHCSVYTAHTGESLDGPGSLCGQITGTVGCGHVRLATLVWWGQWCLLFGKDFCMLLIALLIALVVTVGLSSLV